MADVQIQISEKITGKKAVIEIGGDLDAKTTPAFKAKLDSVLAQGVENLLIDCARLIYIASAGIGALNAARIALKDKGGTLALSSLSQDVRDTMDLMLFTKRVAVYNSLAEGQKNL